MIAVGPAFGDALRETINGLPHADVLRAVADGVREGGASRGSSASAAVSDVAFIGHDGAKLSGSGVAVGLQSKGTAVIHRADLQPLDNLELFGMSPLYSLDSYRAMGRNAAAYALGHAVGPVPTTLDNFARAKLIVRTTLLHARETAAAVPGRRAGRAGARVKIYFAGPLFTPAERAVHRRVRGAAARCRLRRLRPARARARARRHGHGRADLREGLGRALARRTRCSRSSTAR